MVDDKAVTEDAPMESSEDAPAVAEDDQTAGEGSTSDAAAGDEERSSAPGDDEDESKSVSTTTNIAMDEDAVGEEDDESKCAAEEEEETKSPEAAPSSVVPPPKKKRGKPQIPASARKGRAPAVKGLNIPFRTVKKVSCWPFDPKNSVAGRAASFLRVLARPLNRVSDRIYALLLACFCFVKYTTGDEA